MAEELASRIWWAIQKIAGWSEESSSTEGHEIFEYSWGGRPASLSKRFVGRQADLDRVAKAIKECRAVVISGGSGLGKSRLATEYTYAYNPGGFWTVAGLTAARTLHALAQRLGIETRLLDDKEVALEVGRVVAGLPLGTIWVIDDLLNLGQINEILAVVGRLNLLVTSRDSSTELLPPDSIFLPLVELAPESAVELLRSRGGYDSDEMVLNEIADIVGLLPIALEMLAVRIGAHLSDANIVLAELNETRNPALVQAFRDAIGQDLGRPEGVCSAITITLSGLPAETRRTIGPFGYLADDPVPIDLACSLAGIDRPEVAEVISECESKSILIDTEDGILFHPLIRAAITLTNQPDALQSAIVSSASRASAISAKDTAVLRAEISHYEALHIHAKKQEKVDSLSALDFAHNLAVGYRALGRTEEAVKLDEETLDAKVKLLGVEHPDTLSSKGNLATGYNAMGRASEGVALDEETLDARVKVLGREHPATLFSRGNLATGYRAIGRIEDAVELDEETLDLRLTVLGPEHPDTLDSRRNLAIGYQALGRSEEGVKLIEESLDVMERVLGPEHPKTLSSRSCLAFGYQALGQVEEGVKLDEEILEIMVRVLGLEHPNTLSCRNNLVIGYRMLGRTEESVNLGEETLDARVKVLGLEHWDTLGSRNNLITSYREAGRDAAADALATDERFPAADEG